MGIIMIAIALSTRILIRSPSFRTKTVAYSGPISYERTEFPGCSDQAVPMYDALRSGCEKRADWESSVVAGAAAQ